jgi:hypothetical protein
MNTPHTQRRKPRKLTSVAKPKGPTAGARLIADLSKDDDPFSLWFLIEQAGVTADHLERLTTVLRGDQDAWLEVKIGAKTVEVVVTNVLVQHRQTTEQLRKLLYEIHRQRAAIPGDDDDDDVTADL